MVLLHGPGPTWPPASPAPSWFQVKSVLPSILRKCSSQVKITKLLFNIYIYWIRKRLLNESLFWVLESLKHYFCCIWNKLSHCHTFKQDRPCLPSEENIVSWIYLSLIHNNKKLNLIVAIPEGKISSWRLNNMAYLRNLDVYVVWFLCLLRSQHYVMALDVLGNLY